MTTGQPASEFRYWAFISYSHKDASWGSWLHKALETYRVPRRLIGMPIPAGTVPTRLSPIFRDRDELPTTTDLGAAVEEALGQSWCLIVICSPEAAKSRWVNEEVLAFQRLGRGDRIHCLIVEGGPDPAAPLCFPPSLEQSPSGNGNGKSEPVAADARRFGDGRSHALLKLIAGILGIRFDTLVQREQQRKHRKLFWITCASLALVVVLAISTLVAVTSRREAVDQRSHAEGLVEFMIGDLRKKIEPDGKLATLDAVGKEALAYYASQKSEDLDAEGLARRARALHMIGEVYDLRGELDKALDVFEKAAESTAELLAREPDNGKRIFDHAQSVYWVGYIAYQRGNISVAEPAFQDYKRLAERLVAIDPDNEDWQAELGFANSNLGTLLYDQGRNQEAADLFQNALQIADSTAQAQPENPDYAMQVGKIRAWLADNYYAMGLFAEAEKQRQTEVAIYSGIIESNPKNSEARAGILIGERALGYLAFATGNLQLAIAHLTLATRQADILIELDPDNLAWAEFASAAYADLAESLVFDSKLPDARFFANRAMTTSNQLTERDSTVLAWQQLHVRCQLVYARIQTADGNTSAALETVSEGMKQLDALGVEGTVHNQVFGIYPKALLMAGELEEKLGNAAEGRNLWSKAIEMLSPIKGRLDPGSQLVLAIAMQKHGRTEGAERIFTYLDSIGFRPVDRDLPQQQP